MTNIYIYFFILFTTGSIVIFHNKSLTPLEIDNNKYTDVSSFNCLSAVIIRAKKEKENKTKQNNLKNENSEKMLADHYDR